MSVTLDHLRRLAVRQTLFAPTTLQRALRSLGFVQADPIRAPARAQDLVLRHRVRNYRAGDLERRYPELDIQEDFFVNYGFVDGPLQELMHPRTSSRVPAEGCLPWPRARRRRAELVLEFVRQRAEVHPREVDRHFSHGRVTNYWGGSSNATTHLLDAMHYRGLLRVVRREAGIRLYAAHQYSPGPGPGDAGRERLDALIDAAVRIYAPLPGRSLSFLIRRLRFAVPQWRNQLTSAIERAQRRLSHARLDGVDWYWPHAGDEASRALPDTVRLLTPFDPIVWDRARFELLWGWVYRFEAYTPASKRKLGYYALPLLWRDRVIGWGNLIVKKGELGTDFGYVQAPPRDAAFRRELDAELARVRLFLRLDS